jgi:L-amino acid N-acyltransferase YncA
MIAYPNFSYSLRQENLMSSHPSIKIRPLLTVEEITVIANIQLDSWQATFCNEKLGSAIHSAFISAFERRWSQKIERGYQILVIEAANEIVGFVGFCLFSDSSNLSEICDIHVTPSARIHGYGKLLCDAALAEIKKAGFKVLRSGYSKIATPRNIFMKIWVLLPPQLSKPMNWAMV